LLKYAKLYFTNFLKIYLTKLSSETIHQTNIMMLIKNSFIFASFISSVIGSRIRECQIDCERDSDCDSGLLCADDHSIELRNQGYSPKKAYCTGDTGYSNADVCYDPYKVVEKGPGAPYEPQGNKQLCESDCDFDSNCAKGLLCADEHGPELVAKGFDEALANCNVHISDIYEVCFDPAIISDPGEGLGGTFQFDFRYNFKQFVTNPKYNPWNLYPFYFLLTLLLAICRSPFPHFRWNKIQLSW
jgi:hypothetical protein